MHFKVQLVDPNSSNPIVTDLQIPIFPQIKHYPGRMSTCSIDFKENRKADSHEG